MKKKLLFTSAIALLLAGCAQDELGQLEQAQVQSKGISFSASMADDAQTRASLSPDGNVFNVKWQADKDRIGVFYKVGGYLEVNQGSTAQAVKGDAWMGLQNSSTDTETNSFAFKASASGTSGYFVAASDADVLWLTAPAVTYDEAKRPTFRAYWPLEETRKDFAATAGNTEIALPGLATQAQSSINGDGILAKSFMYSETKSKSEYDANDNSVSKDRFSLSFNRISPIVYFKIKADDNSNLNTNREYVADYAQGLFTRFGKLKTVKLTATGKAEAPAIAASNLTYNTDAKWDMAASKLNEGFKAGTTGSKSEIITTMNTTSGLDWSNEATAYMVVANVDRKAFRTAGAKEKVTATYTFANITLTTSIETDKDWSVTEKNWYGFPTESGYDLNTEPYIAYDYGTGNFALEVNASFTGKLSDLFDASGNLKGIKKGNDAAISKSDIKHFVSKKNITAAEDFTTIKSLTTLTNVTLLENTTIPAEALKGLTNLVYLNLPKVTTVANVNAFPANNYTSVYMGSYDFSDKTGTNQTAVRELLLNASHLEYADISAVSSINAGFPQSGVSFQGFTKLKQITVKNGVEIGGTGFQKCAELAKVQFPKGVVNGNVKLTEGGNSQFDGCKKLTAIAISNTVIPDAAFKDCEELATITNAEATGSGKELAADIAKKQIHPTTIGISSFEGCKAIKDMDLSKAATIGAAAFKDCIKLVGNNSKNEYRTVLYVNAITHVSDNVFNGCTDLKFISFANATTIGVGILEGVTCTEIEFLKAFTVNSEEKTLTASTNFFGTVTATKLFCNKAQTGIVTNTLTLKGNATDSEAVPTTFGGTIEKAY